MRRALLIVVLIGCGSRAALAQTPAASTVPPFVMQSDNGDNRLQIGALVQLDGRFAVGDAQRNVTDTFVVRRFRPILQGRVARYFEFFLNVDFAGGVTAIQDAYVDTRFSDAFRVRLGKTKVPLSVDRLIVVAALPFVERGLPATVAPNRDLGVEVLGELGHGTASYVAHVGNGVVDGGSSDVDTNDGKEVAGRLLVRPWARHQTSPIAGLGFAAAASSGTQPAALPVFLSSARQTYFSYAGATGEGRRTRWSPQVVYYHGRFGGYAEYLRSRGGIRKGTVAADVDHEAWQAAATWVLTGESASDRNVRPANNFDPARHHWGALQLVARYHALAIERDAITLGFAAPGASRTAAAWTAGVNWYPNPYVKWLFNVERTVFDGDSGGPRSAENAVLFRGQVAF